ncbi:flagellar hook-basal body complex protein FliE [Halolamina sp. CBA1230]|uniref:AAA family ATPase n=1 Tax=Halolamina sp. CBA1230 TaxID=1853690 RepID=UPI0009A24168|nr:AAA family ATPase [Halolamina sp. CBA1230]QKY20886.1 flagellar hook-basal body complex protein FliE [Halolamina sp. CBA1230]
MRIIGTVGLPGSGKGEAAAVAREEDIPVVTMGDVIRAETRRRGLDPTEHHGEIAGKLREEEGETAIADRCIPMVREAAEGQDDEPIVLVDGLRSMAEVERFVDAFGEDFLLVSIEAPFDLRAKRLGDRGREATDLDREKLREREERELGFGMGEVIDAADLTIDNDDSLERFREQVRAVLERGTTDIHEEER